MRVALCQEDENILLVVEDDGIGFCETGISNSLGSLGLLGMKERAQFCGGDVQISSSPGNGTTVTVRVPVDIPRAERSEIMHILIADDHAVVRRGLKEILADALPTADFCEAGNGDEVLSQLGKSSDSHAGVGYQYAWPQRS